MDVKTVEIRQLKTFVTTARLLSFTKAADELGYAQSTVTGQIQALEEELGVMVYERFAKQIKLTKEGERLYAYATQILALSSEAKDYVASASTPRGVLTIGTAESLCLHRLPGVFNTFRALCPQVEISICFDIGSDYRALVRKNLIDLAIFFDVPCCEPDLITHVLFEEPMTVIAAPSHPLTGKPRISPGDLSGEALVLTPEGCTYRRIFESILTQAGARPSSVMGISSNEVIKRFVGDGWGIGFLPRVVVEHELAAGHLAALNWAGPPFSINAQLTYHKNKWLSPALKAFIGVALEQMPAAKAQREAPA
ncbi:LysR family transcriptional regulator [Anaeroselena agilis]|uniref:LysR family transcriptional regulator n=1 Tax=Anaeroselena agilis TaxID=3063788 RepID=A0ABU3NT36_9FIRM|nr:LysR family transcriptional regulator [Selenomonadales bacterium 4137-cl]